MKITGVKSLVIREIKVIQFQRFKDNRGYFTELFRESDIKNVIPDFKIHQINESYSLKNVLRGLHFQWNPYMGKLIRTVQGHMVDLFLDIRKNSSTFGKIAAYDMPSDKKKETAEFIWVPTGFAHGNFYLEDSAIEYLCTSEYRPGYEVGINPLSDDLDWSLCDKKIKNLFDDMKKSELIISEKDKNGLTLSQWTKSENSNNFT